MSDFDGPGSYVVVPSHVRDKALELGEDSGLLISKLVVNDNQRFYFASVGDEYLIINAQSGTYLTASDNGEQIAANTLSPDNQEARWNVIPADDDSGTWFITSVAFPHKVIDIAQKDTDDGTPAITFTRKRDGTENQQFFLRSFSRS
ncbi:ricin B lectin domain-containing protein [Aspergillus pseudonomiae]|uniref:Ricin B lectin domain-containing protein n=1 Tax=Aspergillus pseudonomiae TaxID=1506151 RepID=A0A5N7DL25_9EURO|nr:ricin B lectin domain-containing protein [Aspergillus pseudonomiae]KAB8261584.1 ricin B lectin domain-containing protein [Aspergillus pseudonomiae]KAE8406819.1 ricin B lectin domain-containing protein [Aspergillus pseudonomiae]